MERLLLSPDQVAESLGVCRWSAEEREHAARGLLRAWDQNVLGVLAGHGCGPEVAGHARRGDRFSDPREPNGRTPTIEEAPAVVQVAVTAVQWARDGKIARR